MTNEEWERKVEFIVSQQAQFSADIQQLKELHAQAEARMTRMERIIVGLHEDTDARFNALAEDTNAKFSALVDSQMRLDARFNALAEDTNAKFNALVDSQVRLNESQARTDERLNSFINVVERYISEGRNGTTTHQSDS
jgi:chromosome segregation ATPase